MIYVVTVQVAVGQWVEFIPVILFWGLFHSVFFYFEYWCFFRLSCSLFKVQGSLLPLCTGQWNSDKVLSFKNNKTLRAWSHCVLTCCHFYSRISVLYVDVLFYFESASTFWLVSWANQNLLCPFRSEYLINSRYVFWPPRTSWNFFAGPLLLI